LVALELDELEGPRADRLGAHIAGGYVAGVDWAVARGKEGEERRLRTTEMKDHLVLTINGYLLQVVPPELARVPAERIGALLLQPVHGADDILRGERFAIMPHDIVA